MPRKPQKQKKRRFGELTPEMVENLLHGFNMFVGDNAFTNEKHCRAMWRKHGEYILTHYRDRKIQDDDPVTDLTYPSGCRPHAWWSYEAPEMRRLISGNVEPFDGSIYFGRWQKIKKADWPIVYESQFDFLERHNLLFEGEREAYLQNLQVEEQKKFSIQNRVDKVVDFEPDAYAE